MPWWSWIVIWIALTALSLVYIALLGLWLWRRMMRTLSAFEDAGAQLGAYQRARAGELEALRRAAEKTAAEHGGTPSPGSAVFASPEQMKDDYVAAKDARISARRLRRVARRSERGQLQSLRDINALKDVG
ncbi:hypothetical protein [Arthrobacter sp. 35W]|uniref:hypothetical protein n=1 Tax=Arthrobacter sp. 35W TaxID=1132441 RepID=UPI00047B4C8E|nr:hypothetical protein [Arthrobacter sp. 35W]